MKILRYIFLFGGLLLFVLGCYAVYRTLKLDPIQPKITALSFQQKLADGRKQYHVRGCVKCHGISGLADGEKSYRLKASGYFITPLAMPALYLQGSSLSNIEYSLLYGVNTQLLPLAVQGKPSPMPRYTNLTDIEIKNISLYVRLLAGYNDDIENAPAKN